ncbi:MAG: RNA-binding protein [Alphaproteobacteria bacterium]|nr:RNA-binding protein [Alphaproteobacteria bacterium]
MQPEALTSHDPALTDTPMEPETDAGPVRAGARAARDPERRCIATMERRPQTAMIRFVLSPDGEVTPDLSARLPGRGAWVSASREALATALKKGAFGRAFKASVKAAPDLAEAVERLLARRVLDMLGLSKRAGDLIIGFEKVREALRVERPSCLIEALDGSADGRGKLLGLARAAHGEMGRGGGQGEGRTRARVPVVGCFTADELGMALGRERVIHACLKQGRFAHAWLAELTRLSGFRRLSPEDWDPGNRGLEDRDPEDRRPEDRGKKEWRPESRQADVGRADDGRSRDGLSAPDCIETE